MVHAFICVVITATILIHFGKSSVHMVHLAIISVHLAISVHQVNVVMNRACTRNVIAPCSVGSSHRFCFCVRCAFFFLHHADVPIVCGKHSYGLRGERCHIVVSPCWLASAIQVPGAIVARKCWLAVCDRILACGSRPQLRDGKSFHVAQSQIRVAQDTAPSCGVT